MFFITCKILIRLNVAFGKFTAAESYAFIFHETFVPVNGKTPPDVHNSLILTWYERATVGNSLHV